MIKHSNDYKLLGKVMEPYSADWVGFHPKSLVKDERNVLLTDGEDNFALFEYKKNGIYEGHYLFANARGKNAITVSRKMLEHFFRAYEPKMIYGKTPVEKKGALWLNKQLGFEDVSRVIINDKEYQLVVLTKERFNQ